MGSEDINKKVDRFLEDESKNGEEVCDEQGKCYIKTDKGFIDKKEHTRENKKVIVDKDGRQLLT